MDVAVGARELQVVATPPVVGADGVAALRERWQDGGHPLPDLPALVDRLADLTVPELVARLSNQDAGGTMRARAATR